MKSFVLISDLHIDNNKFDWSCLEEVVGQKIDTVVVAGDVSNYVFKSCRWLVQLKSKFKNVIWVAGNHDFYNLGFGQTRSHDAAWEARWPHPCTVDEILAHYKRWSDEHGIVFLHRESVVLEGITFIGATGWHDYQAGSPYDSDFQIKAWYEILNDNRINWDGKEPNHLNPFNAGLKDLDAIKQLLPSATEQTVVITHHLPRADLCWQKPHDQIWTLLHGSFANTAMESITDSKIKYWVYGHTHNRTMKTIGNTDYVCNPKGYQGENPNWTPIVLDL